MMKNIKKTVFFSLFALFCTGTVLSGQFLPAYIKQKTPKWIAKKAELAKIIAENGILYLNSHPIKSALYGYKGLKVLYITIPILCFPFAPKIAASRLKLTQKYTTKLGKKLAEKYASHGIQKHLVGPKSYIYQLGEYADNWLSIEQVCIKNYANNGLFTKNNICVDPNPIYDFENPTLIDIASETYWENKRKNYEV